MPDKIPIQNIYYLLCYAWDKLDEGETLQVSASDYNDALNLFGRVLVNGCRHLFKRGLDRSYIEVTDEYAGVKGKINIKASLNKNLFNQGRSICTFDNFESDILHNQLIKATLARLLKTEQLDAEIKKEVWDCYWRMDGVSDIRAEIYLFTHVRLHRNNSFYDLLIRVCRLVIENTTLNELSGKYKFRDFTGSDKSMANLFESFIRNFYKKELSPEYVVRREDIAWNATLIGGSTSMYLPKMQTDVTIESGIQKIIIETKYYAEALNSRFETEKFISGNLYQLYAYLRNIEFKKDHPLNPSCAGLLLYPAVNYSIDQEYAFGAHNFKVKTIDLNAPWNDIRLSLLGMISAFILTRFRDLPTEKHHS